MRRVARRVVVRTFDTDEPGWQDRFWLTRDYLPEFATVLGEFPRLPGWPTRSAAAPSRCPSRGTAPTACSRRTGGDRGAYREDHVRRASPCGRGSGRRPSSGRCEAQRRRLGRWAERNSDLAGLDAADLGLRLLSMNGRRPRSWPSVRPALRPVLATGPAVCLRTRPCCRCLSPGSRAVRCTPAHSVGTLGADSAVFVRVGVAGALVGARFADSGARLETLA